MTNTIEFVTKAETFVTEKNLPACRNKNGKCKFLFGGFCYLLPGELDQKNRVEPYNFIEQDTNFKDNIKPHKNCPIHNDVCEIVIEWNTSDREIIAGKNIIDAIVRAGYTLDMLGMIKKFSIPRIKK